MPSHRVHMQVDKAQRKWLRQEFGSAQQEENDGRWGLNSRTQALLRLFAACFPLLKEESSTRWAGSITPTVLP